MLAFDFEVSELSDSLFFLDAFKLFVEVVLKVLEDQLRTALWALEDVFALPGLLGKAVFTEHDVPDIWIVVVLPLVSLLAAVQVHLHVPWCQAFQ